MKKMNENEIIDFLMKGTKTGKLATVLEDGRPHVAPIWYVWNEGKISQKKNSEESGVSDVTIRNRIVLIKKTLKIVE